ncbi:MAG: hypothetical protein ACWA5Q_01360 [bacterium]
MKMLFTIASMLLLSACGDEAPREEPTGNNHPWRTQTDTIDKAKGVEDTILQGVQRRDDSLDRDSQ